MNDTARIDNHIAAVIQPVLDKHGAAIIARNYDVFYEVVTMQFRGEQIPLPISVIDRNDPTALTFFFRHYDQLQAIVERLRRITDPFYSDLTLAFDSQFGKRSRGDQRTLALLYICDRLKAAGVRIWPND